MPVVVSRNHEMSLSRAAERWDHAMPTGNGRVGALVFGNIQNETILLNHDSLLMRTRKPTLPDISEHLPKLRQLIIQGKYGEADQYFKDMSEIEYDHQGSDSFHPAFNVTIDMPASHQITDERRMVNFETGEVSVEWKEADVSYQRKVFVSRKDGVLVIGIRASTPGMVNCQLGLLPTGLERDELGNGEDVRVPRFPIGRVAKIKLEEVPITFQLSAEEDLLTLLAKYDVGGEYNLAGGDEYGGCARVVVKGGQTETSDLQVKVTQADEVLMILKLYANEESAEAVSRVREELERLDPDYEDLLDRHAALHRELFLRTQLDLEGRDEFRDLPNEKLIEAAQDGHGLNAMMERMFDFGRYSLICSSGSEGMPANLQGIWVGEYGPPWAADYHADINIQMNYFQALPGNMAEIALPYFDYYESMLDDFRTNARNIAGCRGILAPISGSTHGLAGLGWACWTAGAGWLAQLFYDYWLYTCDRGFLEERAVPFMREVALFYEDFLTEGGDGRYIFAPSFSPENVPTNTEYFGTMNATMDIAIARELLENLCEACKLLGLEEAGVSRWRRMLDKLPPYLINEDGALKEWSHPDFEDKYEHRHMSHLYPAYPGLESNCEGDPWLFEACRAAISKKMSELKHPCVWTYVQAASTCARLEKAELAMEALDVVAQQSYTLPNLFTSLWLADNHLPPMMQFEASSGAPAAIMDMLLFSKPGMIKLLPALPKSWPAGSATGLSARGGFEVDISWKEGRLEETTIRSLNGNSCQIHYGDKIVELKIGAGESYLLSG